MLVENPGISIVAIDGGGTTGIAIWDAWQKRLFVDQIDAGRGRKVRQRVHSGFIESVKKEKELAKLPRNEDGTRGRHGRGASVERAVESEIERGVAQIVLDVVRACGPIGVLVIEDFNLAAGRGVTTAKREGLSSLRIGTRIEHQAHLEGYVNGDAWREWSEFGVSGSDRRGMHISGRNLADVALPVRLLMVERWRLEGDESYGGLWPGKGWSIRWQMPGQRIWLPGGESAVVESLKRSGMWMPGAPHGMDALEHLIACSRGFGSSVQCKPERLWSRGETNRRSG